MSDRPFRVLPRVTTQNEHFWRGGERGKLCFLRCRACRTYVHPPSPRCEEVLTRVRGFLDGLELPEHPDPFSLDLDLKRRVQEASAAAGLYCAHLPPADGSARAGSRT